MRNIKGLIILFILLLLLSYSNVYASDVDTCEYSSDYMKFLALNKEEQSKINISDSCRKTNNTLLIESVQNSITINKNSLPSYYNLVNENRVTPVKNQMSTGTCWAFGTYANIESYMLTKYNTSYNLSERHMEYATARTFLDGINTDGFDREVDDGGNYFIAFGYLMSHKGPILEEEMPFKDDISLINLSEIKNKNTILDVNGINHFGSTSCSDVQEQVKNYLYENGALTTSIYWPTSGYVNKVYNNGKYNYNLYYPYNQYSNHTVAIVGWDDNYSKDNFLSTPRPSNDGAWIVRNSWGSSWGNDGYFYVSYEDKRVCESLEGVTSVEVKNYDNYYTHTTYSTNSAVFYKTTEAYGAAIYSKNNEFEYLTEVSIGSLYDVDVEIYVLDNINDVSDLKIDNATLVAKGTISNNGYDSLKLDEPYLLTGDKFAVIVKYNGTADYLIGIVRHDDYISSYLTADLGETLISRDGINFMDAKTAATVEFILPINVETKNTTRSIEYVSTTYEGLIDNTIENNFDLKYVTTGITNNSVIDYKIIDSNDADVTNKFKVTGNKVVDKNINLNIVIPENTTPGNYKIVLTYEGFIKEFNFSVYQGERITLERVNDNIIFNKINNNFDIKMVYTTSTNDNTIVKVYKDNEDVTSNFNITNNNNIYNFNINKNIDSGTYKIEVELDRKSASIEIEIYNGDINVLEFTNVDKVVKIGTTSNVSYNTDTLYKELINISSSDDSVIKINNDGTFTALKRGTSTITISSKYNENIKDQIVIKAIDMKLSLDNLNIDTGDYDKIYNKIGGKISADINSQDITDLNIIVHNSNLEKVSEFELNYDTKSLLLNIPVNSKKDTYCIKATGEYKDNNNVIGTVTSNKCFNIEEYILVSEIKASDITLYEEDVTSLLVTIYPEEAMDQKLVYTSGDNNIVTIDEYGTITAHNIGTTTIKIENKLSGVIKTINVEVKCLINKNNNLEVKDGNLNYFVVGTKVSDVKNIINVNKTINIYNQKDKLVNDDELIGTGYYVLLSSNKKYYLVVKGDLNGDTKINSADLLKMRQHLLGKYILKGPYKEAAMIATGKTINSADLLRIRQHLLGTKLIK